MKNSKPAKRVELVSLGADGLTVDDLLTVKVSPKVRWLKGGIGIGDAGLHPAEPLLAVFERLRLPDFFQFFDLTSIAKDGLEGLQKVGGDGDGHEYLVGVQSGLYYAMWHGQTAFEPVARTAKEFIQWVIRERSDHLQGCPWEVFITGQIQWKDVWHREQVDPAPLLEQAREVAAWTREYASPLGFELLSEGQGIDLRFKKEHRGHNSYIDVRWVGKAPRVEAYLGWLKRRGFGRVWN
jgi:hypothetical protein